TPFAYRGCSIVHRGGMRLRPKMPGVPGGGRIIAKRAVHSREDAIFDSPNDILDFARPRLGLRKLERGLAAKRQNTCVEPSPRVFIGAKDLFGATEQT